jgi:hypothetical protein
MKEFNYWDNLHRNENLEEFSSDQTGLLWLKLKSIIRVELVKGFLDFSGLEINTQKQSDNFRALFELLSKDLNNAHLFLTSTMRHPKNYSKILVKQLSN